MARVLIVPFNQRGAALARALGEQGHSIRATTRNPSRLEEIAAGGVESTLADPDRIGTLMEALSGVTILCWLLGTATDGAGAAADLHSGRLRMLFEKLVDTPVRGVLYEATGTLSNETYATGREIAEKASSTWHIPIEIIETPPVEKEAWLDEASQAVNTLLDPTPSLKIRHPS